MHFFQFFFAFVFFFFFFFFPCSNRKSFRKSTRSCHMGPALGYERVKKRNLRILSGFMKPRVRVSGSGLRKEKRITTVTFFDSKLRFPGKKRTGPRCEDNHLQRDRQAARQSGFGLLAYAYHQHKLDNIAAYKYAHHIIHYCSISLSRSSTLRSMVQRRRLEEEEEEEEDSIIFRSLAERV